MSFLKNLLRPFVEFDETKKEEPVKESGAVPPPRPVKAAPAARTPAPVPAAAPATVPAGAPPPPADPTAFEKYFDDLLEAANRTNPLFEGTDFKEFLDSKADVEAITDEATRYRTAFNVLKRTGLTKGRLIATAHEYIKIVEQDVKGFERAFSQQYTTEVEEKERLLQQKAAEVQQLQERIAALHEEMKQLSTGMLQQKEELTAKRASFVQAGENKLHELRSELQKIEQYF
ncbi:hypothetical protein V9K67_20455 [Paraflavisolibacter sp. H34]|uniref:hypothetical protein n=1 Tax=Huijunlia imazamoxiresistens TaxID=3127457 RepID=UPI00301A06E6